MEVGRAPADRVETVSIHESPEMIPAGKQVSESLQECFPSGSPAATWYLFFGNECIIYQFHMHYNLGFACFLTEAVFVLSFFFSLPQDSPGLSCGFSAV